MTVSKAKALEEDSSFTELYNRIYSDCGLIFVDTPEETRLIRNVFKKFRDHSVQFWSVTQGLIEIPKRTLPEVMFPHDYSSKNARTRGQALSVGNIVNTLGIIEDDSRKKTVSESNDGLKHIYILRDADKFLDAPGPLRALRDIIYLVSSSSSSIIICGYGLKVPSDLEKDSAYIKLKFPTKDEIENFMIPKIVNKINNANSQTSKENRIDTNININEVSKACTGLTEEQIINIIGYSSTVHRKIDTNTILEEKKQIINKSDILEYWNCSDTMDNVGGLGELKKWFAVKKICMTSPYASDFRVKPPKGIMLLGVQGSGKTLVAKALAHFLGVGCIKFETGKVFAGIVGESEKRMRQALIQVEAAGGVVIMDEIDKSLSGAGSSDKTDGGTTSRVIGTLLTWLSEPHPGVFLVATANDITNLRTNHPELFRKGRFDEIWFVDVPTKEEREEIIKIHLTKRGRDISRLDMNSLSDYVFTDNTNDTYPLTGAEIEYAIEDAIQEKFSTFGGKKIELNSKDDITTEEIIDKMRLIKPISWISRDTIQPMRKWTSENARRVSSSVDKKETKTSDSKRVNLRKVNKDITLE